MAKLIDQWIGEAEKKWLDPLYENARRVFEGTFLPSHDHEHHRRVWKLCKYLLREISGLNRNLDPHLVEGLLVSAWFHDLGMSLSMDVEHGLLGKNLCELFFREQGLPRLSRYVETLEAIEKHDLKEESVYSVFMSGKPPDILAILSIADDLDAFGTIGIYRYAEIYLHRNIAPHLLGVRILENARKRYWNVVRSCRYLPAVTGSHNREYELLIQFYNLYNQQLLLHDDPWEVLHGQLGIINCIRILGIKGGIRPESYLPNLDHENAAASVQSYFKDLKEELER